MQLDWQGWSQFILALVAVVGGIGAHRLNRRGQVTQGEQQRAANELATRAQGFEEMEAIVERLTLEAARIEAARERDRAEVARVEAARDKDRDEVRRIQHVHEEALAEQARRCRISFEHFVTAFTVLQGQVVSEQARQAAIAAQAEADEHVAKEHPDVSPAG